MPAITTSFREPLQYTVNPSTLFGEAASTAVSIAATVAYAPPPEVKRGVNIKPSIEAVHSGYTPTPKLGAQSTSAQIKASAAFINIYLLSQDPALPESNMVYVVFISDVTVGAVVIIVSGPQ